MKKVCSKCGELKSLDDFYKRKDRKVGVISECIICSKERCKKYHRTKDGLVTKIYYSQICNSKQKGNRSPTYSKQELKEWLFSQKIFHELYDKWKDSGYDKMLVPSCDRTDDYQGYSLDRLQLMTWGNNINKSYEDKKNGVNNKNSIAVISIHKITNKETEYYSMHQAERQTGIFQSNISKCCANKKKHNSAGGYYWKYSPTTLI